MSVFRVKLNNGVQGALDTTPTSASIQRTVTIMGPNRTIRVLNDGATFTDCNYYKRFAYPQCSLADAIVEVVTDDGTTYVDGEDSIAPVVWQPGTAGTVAAGLTYTDTNMEYDVVAEHGGPATFVQIQNTDSSDSIRVKLNDSAVFTLAAASEQIFNSGDLTISKIAFDNTSSGASSVATITVIIGAKVVCNS